MKYTNSDRELRRLIKIRGYWNRESDERVENQRTPVVTLKDGYFYKEFLFPNSGAKTVEDFLKKNKSRVLKKLDKKRKVNYTLTLTFYNPTTGETDQHHFVKPYFVLSENRDFQRSYKGLNEFFNEKIAEFEGKGSGWTLESIDSLDVKVTFHDSQKIGFERKELPKQLRYLKNDNIDQFCFKHAVEALTQENLNWKGICFPVEKKDLEKFENLNNNIQLFVFSFETHLGIFYKSKNFNQFQDHLNLLMHDNHFYPIEDEQLFLNKILPRRKPHLCKNCLNSFSDLKFHQRYCSPFSTFTVLPPEKSLLKFRRKSEKFQYICFADTEASLIPICEKNGQTEKYQKHKLSHIGLLFLGPDRKEYSCFTSVENFMQKLISYATLLEVNLPLTGIEKYKADIEFLNPWKKCYKCESTENLVKDHCHFTGKYRGILCSPCNLKMQKQKFLPVFFHNFSGYDEKIIFSGLKYFSRSIAKNSENFICIELPRQKIKFLDSQKFLNASLDTLVSTLENLPLTSSVFPDLKQKKGIFPYDYYTSEKVLKETSLPEKKYFYSHLKEKEISDEDYAQAQEAWKYFSCKNFEDYLKAYLKLDCYLLADVFQAFRETILREYDLDPACYVTLPSLIQDCFLKYTKVELELISDPTMYCFIEKGIKGGICSAVKRYAEANNPYFPDHDPTKQSSFIIYNDAVNLYGHAMSQSLPVKNFRWGKYIGQPNCFVEVDVHLPEHCHEKFRDYPLFPEKKGKLICDFSPKKNYICTSEYLLFALKQGYVLDKVHACLEFDSSPWLKPYIENNTRLRKLAKSKFEQDLFKLMNNGAFGKQIEDVRKRINLQIRSKHNVLKDFLKPSFKNIRQIKNLFLVENSLEKVKLDKPIYGGLCILDFSKITMADFLYNYLQPKYGSNHELIYTDTDSFVSHIFTEDYYEDIRKDVELFDTSKFKPFSALSGNTFPVGKNRKVPGKMADENINIKKFVCLKSKCYAYQTFEGETEKRIKGVNRGAQKKILFQDLVDCLEEGEKYGEMKMIRSHHHEIFSEKVNKKLFDGYDTKRKKVENFKTLPL